jgi:hypothetical protein
MDSSMNYYEDILEEIRPPDNVKREQLISNDNLYHDKELEEALSLSIHEILELEKKTQEYEKQIITTFIKERDNRREKFEKLLFNLKKVSKFDKTLCDTYDIIEPIIDSYCNQIIENYLVDEETFQCIFKNLNSIRTDKKIIDILKTIIISD